MILRQRESRSLPALNKNPDLRKKVGVLFARVSSLAQAYSPESKDLAEESVNDQSREPAQQSLATSRIRRMSAKTQATAIGFQRPAIYPLLGKILRLHTSTWSAS